MKKIIFYYLPPIVLVIAIYFVSGISAPKLPQLFYGKDKILHFGVYFVLTYLTARAFSQTEKYASRKILFAILITMLYGAFDEIHQSFVPLRRPDIFDWISDSLGAFAFLYFDRLRNKYFPKK